MIEFIKPKEELIKIMAQTMRRSDVTEVMASHGHTPLESLMYSFENSEYVTMSVYDNVPLMMFGVAVSNIVTGLGCPWLLSSVKVFDYRDELLLKVAPVIADMIAVCPRLVNYVHHENKTSIKWLKSLGFTIEKPEPYGIKGDLFHKFHMGVI